MLTRLFTFTLLPMLLLLFTPASYAARNELKPLSFFAGDWSCVGQFASGKGISSRETFTFILDKKWLKMSHLDNPPHRYKAIELWGYDPTVNRYTVYIFGNAGGARHYSSSGWKGDKLTLTNTATSGYIDRFIFERRGDDEYRVAYASKNEDGTWGIGDALICKRS